MSLAAAGGEQVVVEKATFDAVESSPDGEAILADMVTEVGISSASICWMTLDVWARCSPPIHVCTPHCCVCVRYELRCVWKYRRHF